MSEENGKKERWSAINGARSSVVAVGSKGAAGRGERRGGVVVEVAGGEVGGGTGGGGGLLEARPWSLVIYSYGCFRFEESTEKKRL